LYAGGGDLTGAFVQRVLVVTTATLMQQNPERFDLVW